MPNISIRLNSSDHKIFVAVARQHGGNLTDAFRSLLQKESVMNEIRAEFIAQTAELKAALIPITEAGEAVIKNQEIAAHSLKNNLGIVLEAVIKKR